MGYWERMAAPKPFYCPHCGENIGTYGEDFWPTACPFCGVTDENDWTLTNEMED